MKGLVFTEFLKMVEETFSLDVVDKIIDAANLPNRGAYTSIGTYDYHELLSMVTHLSQLTGISVPELEMAYGKYLFKSLLSHHKDIVVNAGSCFKFLTFVNDHIHIEVKKLYPDAELPSFSYQMITPNKLILEYHSARPFADLAQGLILGCADYFGETIEIHKENIEAQGDVLGGAIFTLEKKD